MDWDPERTGMLVEGLFDEEVGPATIVAPFVKTKALERLAPYIDGHLTLYTRWLPHEVAAGVSDLEVFDVVENLGGEVRLHPRLHAKVYLRGNRALAGSPNLTLTGLGFRDPAGIELLVPVILPSQPVTNLLEHLKRSTPVATEDDRRVVAEQAAKVDAARIHPRRVADEMYGDEIDASPLIQFRLPDIAWFYYKNPAEHNPELVRQLFQALAGLGVPPWITDRRDFEAAVGASMRQGVHGRVLRECDGLPAHAAITRYLEIMGDAGVYVSAERADESWRTFCYWAEQFVPEINLKTTQVGF